MHFRVTPHLTTTIFVSHIGLRSYRGNQGSLPNQGSFQQLPPTVHPLAAHRGLPWGTGTPDLHPPLDSVGAV